MFSFPLPVHDGLYTSSRFGWCQGRRIAAAEWLVLVGLGSTAALTSTFLNFKMPIFGQDAQIPGHAILRAILPMALGLAMVPRRLAGSVMGCSALATALALPAAGVKGLGLPALTSLALTGPLLDLAVWSAQPGWRLYLRLALAGLASNGIALAVRLGSGLLGWQLSGGRHAATLGWLAVGSYTLCGLGAGLISGFCWFRRHGRLQESTS